MRTEGEFKSERPARTTRVSRRIRATPEKIYQTFLDPNALSAWRVPDNMTGRMDSFDPREGGSYRMTLTYIERKTSPRGKSSDTTDTFQGTFLHLVLNEKVVEEIRFESPDPQFAGEMRMTTTMVRIGTETEVTILCENLPPGIRLEQNALGCNMALNKLARLVE
ncbi:MAG TPA: SRPBCC domain-containing protein [Terriglobales bacterium]|nr:SRPBCC domain-containing protein [Terriglobales bacterium]